MRGWADHAPVSTPACSPCCWPSASPCITIFRLQPLDGDNLYTLAWADATPLGDVVAVDPEIYPEWRPLAYLTVWLEHQVVPLRAVATHHAINLLIWVICSWLVYRIVDSLVSSKSAAVVAAFLLLVSQRAAFTLLWIIERQTSMACALGLIAVLLIVRARDRNLTRGEWVAVASVLFGSALSKEHGLAFAGAIGTYGLLQRRKDLLWPALAAGGAYAALRFGVVGGAVASYCEDMGYFFGSQKVCIDPLSTASMAQMLYNTAASGIGSVLAGLLGYRGEIEVVPFRAAQSFLFVVFAAFGVLRGDRFVRLVALVPLFNALLGFMLYRERNLVAGRCAVAIAVGVGVAMLARRPFVGHAARAVRWAGIALVAALLCRQAWTTQVLVGQEVADLLNNDPCTSDVRRRALSATGMRRRKGHVLHGRSVMFEHQLTMPAARDQRGG